MTNAKDDARPDPAPLAATASADPAAALLALLETPRLPYASDPDPFVSAWETSGDLDAMIGLLRAGGTRGVYAIDSFHTWDDPPSRWLFRLRLPDQRYVRVDVTREGGALALRAIVPSLEPRAVWVKGVQAAHDAIEDPLAQLAYAFATSGAAMGSWVARWGSSPVAAAWQESSDSVSMRWLLERAERADLLARAQAAVREVPAPPPGSGLLVSPAMERESKAYFGAMADAVRRVVPVPPMLRDLYGKRPPADPHREQMATVWWREGLSPEHWAALHGHEFGASSFDEYTYGDPALDDWIQRVHVILNAAPLLERCREECLSEEERERIASESEGEF